MRTSLVMALAIFASTAVANSLQESLIENLYAMKSIYRTGYAPAAWKKTYANYDLDVNFQQAVAAASAKPNLAQGESREILKKFIYAMKDYHVSIMFVSTETATLPLTIKGAGDRFFLAYIDRAKLPESSFPYHVGDEVVSFGGISTLQAVQDIQADITENVTETDRALAELALTNRRAARGYQVPKGSISLGLKQQGSDKISNIQLIWDYTPEQVAPRKDVMSIKLVDKNIKSFLPNDFMMNYHVDQTADTNNPYNIGSRKTFTPDLGVKLWESSDSDTFYAYIYMNKNKKLIGYIRIASYIENDYKKAVADFKNIIARFESMTDALVIDQVDNPGGSAFYLYALASMLTDQPLLTPQHRMSVTQADVLAAKNTISEFQKIKNDDDAKRILPDINGYPISYQLSQFMLSYYQFIVSEWELGHKLTKPYWIGGVNQINPANVRYTQPILLLANHLDFSGGDFFPAILKDNERITILGSRTAGAGGYVLSANVRNNIGIDSFRITGSIAERVNGNPIENLGVKPDIIYEMTPTDYQTNYAPYTAKIKTTVDALIK